MNSFRKEFTTLSITLMAVGIALNLAIGTLALTLKLPLYLDSIGTVLVGALVGPWAGAATGFLSNLVWTLTGLFPQAFAWAGVAAIIGALAGVFARSGWLNSVGRAALAGLITGVLSAVLSAPIATYVFGGVVGAGTDALVAAFRAAGLDALMSNVAQGTFSDPLDKLVTFVVVWALLLALPSRLKASFGNLTAAPAARRPAGKTRRSPAKSRRPRK
jgi:energy-coupling factor transport system substrate-specific component